jgi:hypothetical protein
MDASVKNALKRRGCWPTHLGYGTTKVELRPKDQWTGSTGVVELTPEEARAMAVELIAKADGVARP